MAGSRKAKPTVRPRKRRAAPAPGAAAIAGLKRQLAEARAQQAATAEVLRVISSSPTDTQPVFETIVRSCQRLFGGRAVAFCMPRGDRIETVAFADDGTRGSQTGGFLQPFPLDRGSAAGACILDRRVVNVPDTREAAAEFPRMKQLALALGYLSGLFVPLVQADRPLGMIGILRAQPGRFTKREVALAGTFADQTVIAIENARLFNETREALERQTATAEILKVIASSPSDVQPVFEAIADNAKRLLGGFSGMVLRYDGELLHLCTVHSELKDQARFMSKFFPVSPVGEPLSGRCVLERAIIQTPDLRLESDSRLREIAGGTGVRAVLVVPMLRDGAPIGTISVARINPGAFSQAETELLTTFADQAVIAIENVRLFNETKEALEQQRASADVLGAISGSIADTRPVFDKILDRCEKLFEGNVVGITLATADGKIDLAAYHGRDYEKLKGVYPLPLSRESGSGAAILDAAVAHYPDIEADGVPPGVVAGCRTVGMRAIIFAPMLFEGRGIGAIWVGRMNAGMFTQKQIALLRTFTDQAVIAIQNVRMFNETREALERQTATAEILNVIASSPSDVQPVFDAIAQSATRLLDGFSTAVIRVEGDKAQLAAFTSTGQSGDDALRAVFPVSVSQAPGNVGRAMREKVAQWTEDVEADTSMSEDFRAAIRARGWRSGLAVPMVRQGEVIGAINVTRREPGRFSAHQIGLLTTFADQAVIAIENVRLFNETKDALERQTATAEILRVISSSPTDVQPVFEAIVASGMKLFSGAGVGIGVVNGDEVVIAAAAGMGGVGRGLRMPLSHDSASGTAILERKLVNIADTEAPGVPSHARENGRRLGIRSMVQAPMFREGEPIGSIGVMRKEPGGLDDKQLALLRTFADQAVIAIQNARLFNETREALERQTATAEILKVIASSPSDVQPVFDAIAASARRLLDGGAALVARRDGDLLQLAAYTSTNAAADEALKKLWPSPITGKGHMGRAVLSASPVLVDDIQNDTSYSESFRESARTRGVRSVVSVPMLREGEVIGVISVNRPVAGRFSEHQTNLLRTFADQAVIAIENVRLFKELQTRTEALTKSVGQLTALSEVGQAISSTLELDTVLKTIVGRAVQLSGLDAGVIYEYDQENDLFLLRASERFDESGVAEFRGATIRRGEGAVGRSVEIGQPTQVPDTHAPDYPAHLRGLLDRAGFRALLAVPLLREDHIVGALMVIRRSPGEFDAETVELLRSFAGQSALAIQNARLFREIAEKGRQLEQASQHKSNFLASMSHELRTPLNAILGFNEMILGQVYGEVPADMAEPLNDIQTSGKHLLRLINNVLDLAKIEAGRMELSLQDYSVHDLVGSVHSTLRPLAAEKGLEFLATVPEDLPLACGDGGRIAQCLMNLAGNSIKFTRAGKVEISVEEKGGLLTYRVSDTGIGIPPDKIASLFTEFKQTDATIASEYGGTGLGLSISKKFVEMHGGRIWIESELGKGSTFNIEVPLRVTTS